MNRDEYVVYFNKIQTWDRRRISPKILDLFEKQTGYTGVYHNFPKTLSDIRFFISGLPQEEYYKLVGVRKKSRNPSQYKSTKPLIKSFPIDKNLPRGWDFLAYDLKKSIKYAFDGLKRWRDGYINQNQFYFNPESAINDFLSLNFDKKYLNKGWDDFIWVDDLDKNKIIKFLEVYGPLFIDYDNSELDAGTDEETYFSKFLMEYFNFKKSHEIVIEKKIKNFPHSRKPKKIDYWEWYDEIGIVQTNFLKNIDKKSKKIYKSPQPFERCYKNGICLFYDYLYINCNNLIQCPYKKCLKYFFRFRKDQNGCCPHHSDLIRKERNRKNKK